MGLFSFFSKEKKETLDKGLEKTKTGFFDKFGYNTEIVDSETIEKVKNMGAQYQTLEAETK